MIAQIIMRDDKKKIVSTLVKGLRKIECLYVSGDGEKTIIDSDFSEKFDINGLLEAKFLGNGNSLIIKGDEIKGVFFK